MKRPHPLFALVLATLGLCCAAPAQFRERPALDALRRNQSATRVEGNLFKVLNFAMSGRVTALSFSPKSNYLAVATATTLHLVNETGGRKLLIWDALKQPTAPVEGRPPLRSSLAFAPNDKTLFHCGPQGLQVWQWEGGLSAEQNPTLAWSAPEVYNLAVVDANRVICGAKRGSNHLLQLRNLSDGAVVWEKVSGLLPLTALWSGGEAIRSTTGTLNGEQAYWSEWQISDGKQALPVDLGTQNAFAASFSPDGRTLASVSRSHITTTRDSLALNIIALETGEAKVTTAPKHPPYSSYRYKYRYYWPEYPFWWVEDGSIDTGWTTMFTPDGSTVISIGKEVVFYSKSSGIIQGRIYFSNNPFPDPDVTQAETDGVGAISPTGNYFALVRQARVAYSSTYNGVERRTDMQRKVQGDSAIEVYALGG